VRGVDALQGLSPEDGGVREDHEAIPSRARAPQGRRHPLRGAQAAEHRPRRKPRQGPRQRGDEPGWRRGERGRGTDGQREHGNGTQRRRLVVGLPPCRTLPSCRSLPSACSFTARLGLAARRGGTRHGTQRQRRWRRCSRAWPRWPLERTKQRQRRPREPASSQPPVVPRRHGPRGRGGSSAA
jgi:hypothetical protein